MNLDTSQPSAPVTSDKESSTSHPIVDESLPSSFPYILISLADTTPAMLSSISTTMVSLTPPPFSYPISSTPGYLIPALFGDYTSPSASSFSGSGTTFPFGVGSAPNVGTGVSSTTTAIPSTSATIPGPFSL